MSRTEPSVVLVEGPWTHRDVNANGLRLHVAECGEGPLVLLLHGFPEFWWAFRHQLTGLAAQGFRAVAADLRGYGASDKPPRGYDALTLAADVAGLIRALGETDAVVVGHDWGGFLAWVVATLYPELTRATVVLSMPHPLRMRRALLTDLRGQAAASRYIAAFQVPWTPERRLVADRAAFPARLLHDWGGPGFPDTETEARVREAMLIPGVPHSALEYYRWAVRSLPRPDGLRFARALRTQVRGPVLQVHGLLDTCTLASTALGSGAHVRGHYRWLPLAGVGHFPHEERPEVVTAEIAAWARR